MGSFESRNMGPVARPSGTNVPCFADAICHEPLLPRNAGKDDSCTIDVSSPMMFLTARIPTGEKSHEQVSHKQYADVFHSRRLHMD